MTQSHVFTCTTDKIRPRRMPRVKQGTKYWIQNVLLPPTHTCAHTHAQKHAHTHRDTETHTHTDRETDRQTHTHTHTLAE